MRFAGFALVFGVAGCMPAAAPEPVWHELEGAALGTSWHLRWDGPVSEEAVQKAADQALEEVNARMSTWRADSEISQARVAAGPYPISEDTADVVRAALALAEASNGAFDPTVQPLMEVYGFHAAEGARHAPSEEALAQARAQVGWQKVKLGRAASGEPTVTLNGAALDLSAIAKGHAVDRVAYAMSRLGVANQLVEVGGEVRAQGVGPNGAWRLGVDTPTEGLAPGASLAAVAELTNMSLASSGNYRNVVELDGQRVAHTMDPRTGGPALSSNVAVSVVAPDCREADGLATALMVLDLQAGRALIEAREDVEAMWLVGSAEGWRVELSSGASDWFRPLPQGL